MLHKVKLLSGFYQAVIDGIKPFEIRYNDRNYRKGDDIIFNEWKDDTYTGRLCCAVIKDVFDIGFLMPGYVAFTFQLLGNFEVIDKSDLNIKKVTRGDFTFEQGIVVYRHRFSINRSLDDYEETVLDKCIRIGLEFKYYTMAKNKLIPELQVIYKDENDKLHCLKKDLHEWSFEIKHIGNMQINL